MAMMEAFDDIWEFVEHKLGKVPVYFKNILKVCGFNNGITIASILEEDIVYFEAEVKNGNVASGLKGNKDVLEGSMRPQDNFEFTRGHKKFLLTIAAMLKEHIRENGKDSCIVSKRNIKSSGKATKNKPAKRLCLPSKKKNISNVNAFVESALAIQDLSKGVVRDEDFKEHKRIILNKIVNSLIKHTESMFNENIDSIKEQMSTYLLQIEEKQSANDNENDSAADSDAENENKTEKKCVETANETDTVSKYTAFVKCPYGCIKPTTLFHIPTTLNFFLWNTSNFDRHLKKLHKSEIISVLQKDSITDVTTTKAKSESEAVVNTDNTDLSIVSHPCTSETEEKREKIKPQNQQSALIESFTQDVQDKTFEKVEKIQLTLSVNGEQDNVEKKVKKRKKNKQSLLSDSVKQDDEEKKPEKVEKLKKIKHRIQQSLLIESVTQDAQEKTFEKFEKIQPILLSVSGEQDNVEKKVKKRKKNKHGLLSESIKQDVAAENVEKLEKVKPRIQQSLLSTSVLQNVQQKTFEIVEKIQPILLSGSGEQDIAKLKLKKRKTNQRRLLDDGFRVEEGVEEKIQEKRQKIQTSLMSDGVKDEVKEWVKMKKQERRKKKQLSESVEPDVNKKKLEEGWRKYV